MASATPLDPEEDDTTAAAPGDNSSSDASTGKFQKAWEAWQSRPENNAALLQFGISMLQPHAAGQSGIGAAANAIGEAGQAANRSITSQNTEADRATAEEDKAALRTNQGKTADAALINANAYASGVKNNSGGKGGPQAAIRAQSNFNAWINKDDYGQGDAVLDALKQAHPEIKTKADILRNPQLRAEAYQIFKSASPTINDDGSDGGVPPAPSQTPAATPQLRTIYKGGKPYSWDGINAPVPLHQGT